MMMVKAASAIILVTFSLLSSAASTHGGRAESPFWRVKPKILKKITDDRSIIVLVTAMKKAGDLSELNMQGGGLIKAPIEDVYIRVQKYEDLPKVSDYVKEVRIYPNRSQLYVHTEAFKYHARMTMKVTPLVSAHNLKELQFSVIDGNFKGMTGVFTFEQYKSNLTLMGFEARYEYKKLPMPEFFIEFGLEFVLQKVAARMRSFLENETSL